MHLLAHLLGTVLPVPPPRLYVVREKNARCSLLPLFYSQVLKNLSHFLRSQLKVVGQGKKTHYKNNIVTRLCHFLYFYHCLYTLVLRINVYLCMYLLASSDRGKKST